MTSLFDQRRRLIALCVSSMLTCALFLGLSIWVLIAGMIGLLLAAIIVSTARAGRRVTECMAIALPMAALIPLDPIATPIIVGAVTLLIHVFLYSGWSDRTNVRIRLHSQKTTVFGFSAARAWRHLVPGEGTPRQFWRTKLIDFATDEDDPLTLYLRIGTNSGIPKEAMVTFLSKNPETSCQYLYEVAIEDARVPALDETNVTLEITPDTPHRCVVESTLVHEALLPRLALTRWFDDRLGDEWHGEALRHTTKRKWSLSRNQTGERTAAAVA